MVTIMEFIFELVFEFLFEFFGEIFLNLYTVFLPHREISESVYRIVKTVLVIISVVLFILMLIGVILLIDSSAKSVLGWVFVSSYVLYIVTSIVVWVISAIRQ